MNILSIIILALLGEAVWETLKMTWQEGKASVDRIGALVICVILAFSTNLDLLSIVGIEVYYRIIGVFLTGVLISRGANFLHDFMEKINNINHNSK